jgi:hypothetical protein
MAVPEPDPPIAAVPVDIRPWPAATLTGEGGSWLGIEAASAAARQAVAIWARAVNGDEAALAAVAEPAVAHSLLYRLTLYPPEERIAPGPTVSRIEIRGLELTAGAAPRLWVGWQFIGRLQPEPAGWAGHDWEFFGTLDLTFADQGAPPWLVTSGGVSYLVSVPEYWYVSRDETAAEYRARTGSSADQEALAPSRTYRLRADFAEHDLKVGGTATVEVRRQTTPTRYEAEEIAESAVMAEAERLTGPGEGELHPSMSHLELIRLLEGAARVR